MAYIATLWTWLYKALWEEFASIYHTKVYDIYVSHTHVIVCLSDNEDIWLISMALFGVYAHNVLVILIILSYLLHCTK